jgi:hypothetical protein
VKVGGLERPYYKGKIIFDNEKLGDVSTNFQLEGVDAQFNDATYIIKKKTRKGRTYYVVNGYSFIPLSGKKPDIVENETMPTTPDYEPFVPVVNPQTEPKPNPKDPNIIIHMKLPDPRLEILNPKESPNKPVVIPTPNQPNKEQKNPPPNKEERKAACAYAMETIAFAKGVAAIVKEGFEDNRKSIAQQIIKANCLSIEQIKELMGAMSFEDSRLGVAKLAYAKCTNRDSYYLVNEALQFSASKEDLANFISTK